MSVAAIARPSSMRDIPWAVWVLLALAGLVMVAGLTQSGFQIGSITFAAPILFAAAVVYVAPPDRRFVWGAVLIALAPAVGVITAVLPDVWFDVVPGDWKNATPLLMDLGDLARQIVQVLGYIGLGLLALALGGVRTVLSLAIIGSGVLLAAVNVIQRLANGIEGWPIDLVVGSTALPLLYAGGWAFVFAAAVESRRRLMLMGTGLLFALLVLNYLDLYQPVPGDLLLLGTAVLHLVAWALVILSPLRGELNAAPPRKAGETAA